MNGYCETTKCVAAHSLRGHPSGPSPHHPHSPIPRHLETVEDCIWYYLVLNATLTSFFAERHLQFQTKKNQTCHLIHTGNGSFTLSFKPEFPRHSIKCAPRSREIHTGGSESQSEEQGDGCLERTGRPQEHPPSQVSRMPPASECSLEGQGTAKDLRQL